MTFRSLCSLHIQYEADLLFLHNGFLCRMVCGVIIAAAPNSSSSVIVMYIAIIGMLHHLDHLIIVKVQNGSSIANNGQQSALCAKPAISMTMSVSVSVSACVRESADEDRVFSSFVTNAMKHSML